MKTSSRKRLEKKLDTLWSEKVRERARFKCERCGSDNIVQSHHIFPRTHKGTRWDIDNGVSLCCRCHLYFAHKDAIGMAQWVSNHFEKTRGSRSVLDTLQYKAYGVSKWSESDLELLFDELKQLSYT